MGGTRIVSIFGYCVVFLAGMYVGLYIHEVIHRSTKKKQKVIDDLNHVLKDNWKHCRVEIKAAIEFIEKYT